MKVGIITYDFKHLKTEQLVTRYTRNKSIKEIKIFALPYKPRIERKIIFPHRPQMSKSISTKYLAELSNIDFVQWDGKKLIGDLCDVFIIGGAGIIDIRFALGKPIINAHPGIIPLTRGLDSFKWAIYNGDPVGNTLHLINEEVDKGDILTIETTPIFSTDTIHTLARRHYDLEIEMLANAIDFLPKRQKSTYQEKPSTLRMNSTIEAKMIERFESWKEKIIKGK